MNESENTQPAESNEQRPNPIGRPRGSYKEIDLKIFSKLCQYGLTIEEMAHVLGVDRHTLGARIRSDQEFAAALKKGRAKAQLMIRYQQFKAAQNGSVRMLIHLGKIYLGQTGKTEERDPDDGPLRFDLNKATVDEIKSEIARLAEEIRRAGEAVPTGSLSETHDGTGADCEPEENEIGE
jgi:hypothetical protein